MNKKKFKIYIKTYFKKTVKLIGLHFKQWLYIVTLLRVCKTKHNTTTYQDKKQKTLWKLKVSKNLNCLTWCAITVIKLKSSRGDKKRRFKQKLFQSQAVLFWCWRCKKLADFNVLKTNRNEKKSHYNHRRRNRVSCEK